MQSISLMYLRNMKTLSWETAQLFLFAFLLDWVQHLKERICSLRSKFFSLRVSPFLGGLVCQEKETNVVRLCKNSGQDVV